MLPEMLCFWTHHGILPQFFPACQNWSCLLTVVGNGNVMTGKFTCHAPDRWSFPVWLS
jgi:hypothetical protein